MKLNKWLESRDFFSANDKWLTFWGHLVSMDSNPPQQSHPGFHPTARFFTQKFQVTSYGGFPGNLVRLFGGGGGVPVHQPYIKLV